MDEQFSGLFGENIERETKQRGSRWEEEIVIDPFPFVICTSMHTYIIAHIKTRDKI